MNEFKEVPATDSLDLKKRLAQVTRTIFKKFPPQFTQTISDTQMALWNIGNTTFKSTEQLGNMTTLFSTVQDSLFDNFGIDPPESEIPITDPNEEWNENLEVLALVVWQTFYLSLLLSLVSSHPITSPSLIFSVFSLAMINLDSY